MKLEPAAVITAVRAANRAAARLADTAIQPGMPLTGHTAVISALQDTARGLAGALHAEARLARGALAAIPQAREGGAPDRVLISLTKSATAAENAAELLNTARARTRRQAQAAGKADTSPDRRGQLVRVARAASRAVADLADVASGADRRAWPGTVTPLAAGHWHITEVLSVTCEKLSQACSNLGGPLYDSGRGRDEADIRIAVASLKDAAAEFRVAGLRAADAHATFDRDSIWRVATDRRPA